MAHFGDVLAGDDSDDDDAGFSGLRISAAGRSSAGSSLPGQPVSGVGGQFGAPQQRSSGSFGAVYGGSAPPPDSLSSSHSSSRVGDSDLSASPRSSRLGAGVQYGYGECGSPSQQRYGACGSPSQQYGEYGSPSYGRGGSPTQQYGACGSPSYGSPPPQQYDAYGSPSSYGSPSQRPGSALRRPGSALRRPGSAAHNMVSSNNSYMRGGALRGGCSPASRSSSSGMKISLFADETKTTGHADNRSAGSPTSNGSPTGSPTNKVEGGVTRFKDILVANPTGITCCDLPKYLTDPALGGFSGTGVLVERMASGCEAKNNGLRVGDIIARVNRQVARTAPKTNPTAAAATPQRVSV